MAQGWWTRYGTMDEFIKGVDLRRKEIGLQEDLIPKSGVAVDL